MSLRIAEANLMQCSAVYHGSLDLVNMCTLPQVSRPSAGSQQQEVCRRVFIENF